MSNLFNLSKVFETPVLEQLVSTDKTGAGYLYNAISLMESVNKEYAETTKELYKMVAEASSKQEENEIFAKYFTKINDIIDKAIIGINEMISSFAIKIDNLADANADLLNGSVDFSSIKPFPYRVYKFEHIDDTKFPNFGMIDTYRKEFDNLGLLLQDLGPVGSNQAKLKIIATVYNSFAHKMKDKWRDKCIESIIGEDLDSDKSFAEKLYSEFKPDESEEVSITKGHLYELKNTLDDHEHIIDMMVKTAQGIISDLEYIRNDIDGIIFGHKDNTLKVETSTDGIKNTIYRLDVYSMNQLDIFLKAKTGQIMQMCNLYTIALSIKLDVIVEYFEQCKDILNTAFASTADDEIQDGDTSEMHEPMTSKEPGDDWNTDENEPPVEDDDTGNEPEPEDDAESDFSDPDEGEDSGNNEPDNGDDDSFGADNEEFTFDDDNSTTNYGDSDIKEAVRMFNYDLYELGMMYEGAEMMSDVLKYLAEDGETSNASSTSNVSSDKKSIWRRIVDFFKNLFSKFKKKVDEVTTENNTKKLNTDEWKDYCLNGKGKAIPDDKKFLKAPIISTDLLNEVESNFPKDLNSDVKLKEADSELDFAKKCFPKLAAKQSGDNANKTLSNILIDETLQMKDNVTWVEIKAGMGDDVKSIYTWCLNYAAKCNSINEMNNIVEKDTKAADAISNAKSNFGESAVSLFEDYFNEGKSSRAKRRAAKNNNPAAPSGTSGQGGQSQGQGGGSNYNDPKGTDDVTPDETGSGDNSGNNKPDDKKEKGPDMDTRIKNVLNVKTKMAAAVMTCYSKMYAERMKFLSWYVNWCKSDGKAEEKPADQQNQTSANTSGGGGV